MISRGIYCNIGDYLFIVADIKGYSVAIFLDILGYIIAFFIINAKGNGFTIGTVLICGSFQ